MPLTIRCQICARTKPSGTKPLPSIQHAKLFPFEDIQINFIEVKPCRDYKYLLVLVCTLEAFPARTEKATQVCRVLLREIIPRYIPNHR